MEETFTIEKVERKTDKKVQRTRDMGTVILQLSAATISAASACGCLKNMFDNESLLLQISVGICGINMVGIFAQYFTNFMEELKHPTKKDIEENALTKFTIEKVEKVADKEVKKTKTKAERLLSSLTGLVLGTMALVCAGVGIPNYSANLFELISRLFGSLGMLARANRLADCWNYSTEEEKQRVK